jgi:hypothetical protein
MGALMLSADAFGKWLTTTTVGQQMVHQPWLWPACETLHFVGLALLIGVAGLFDLRLLGFLRRASLGAVMDLRGWAALGLAVNLVTGLMFFAGAPGQYLHNVAFAWKLLFILIAGLNIVIFELAPATKALIASVGPGDDTPLRFKLAGGVSLFSWFAVLYYGRMLPFVGNAF